MKEITLVTWTRIWSSDQPEGCVENFDVISLVRIFSSWFRV